MQPFCQGIPNQKQLFTSTEASTSSDLPEHSTHSKNHPPSSRSIENNPYYSKYKDKIEKAQLLDSQNGGQSGFCKIESISNTTKGIDESSDPILENEIESIKEKINFNSLKIASNDQSKSSSSSRRKEKLDDIVRLELLQTKSKEEIEEIWKSYHSQKDCLYSVLESSSYANLRDNLIDYPSFILPLPRASTKDSTSKGTIEHDDQSESMSYEFFLMQFVDHSCYFTPLAAYHLHQEMAPVCLQIHYYPELFETKGIVLMLGEFDKNILNTIECQFLTNQLQYYYLTKDPAPRLSLHLFNKQPKSFDHMRLIQHLEEGFCSRNKTYSGLNQQD
ncbi:hypothetical protein NH340_JMT06099 [Sarcoptes scabiei]|nr:hypothetical protein NH340_JMT06099 [Sarcoptes scabiei]